MSLTSIDLRTLAAVTVEYDQSMQFCGISKLTRDAVKAAVMDRLIELTLKSGELSELPDRMLDSAPEHIEGHPSRMFKDQS